MIRAKLWFRCAAMHDPVTPMVAQPALVGWEAKKRRVDLTIERSFTGEELIKRMKGWVTTDPYKVIEVVKPFAKMKVLDDRELVLELEKEEDLEKLNRALQESFGGEVDAELITKKKIRDNCYYSATASYDRPAHLMPECGRDPHAFMNPEKKIIGGRRGKASHVPKIRNENS